MTDVTPNFSASQIASEALRQELLILSLIKDVRTTIPVKITAVHPGQGTPPQIGTVDVQPLVQTVDGNGKLWSLGVTYGAQALRIQAGATAIIVDPAVGDVGLAVACDRDISSVIAAMGIAGPGSARTHDISDLVYLFTLVSATAPARYIWGKPNGDITALTDGTLTLQGAQINLIGPVTQTNGDVTMGSKLTIPNVAATTDVTVPNGSVNSHVHAGVTTGTGDTGPMTG